MPRQCNYCPNPAAERVELTYCTESLEILNCLNSECKWKRRRALNTWQNGNGSTTANTRYRIEDLNNGPEVGFISIDPAVHNGLVEENRTLKTKLQEYESNARSQT